MHPTPSLAFFQDLERQAQNRPSGELQRVIDLVWSHRVNHADRSISSGNADVYGIYNRILKNWNYAPAGMVTFLQGLQSIGRPFQVQCSISDGVNLADEEEVGLILRYDFGATRAPSGYADVSVMTMARIMQFINANPGDALVTLLSEKFFHFLGPALDSVWRIYLHVQTDSRISVMRWIVNNVVPLPGCSDAKVCGPGEEYRADSIVIYLENQATSDQALKLLRNYQANPERREQFLHGPPRMTREIQDLCGVGVGAEPVVALESYHNRLRLTQGNSTFGTYREQLIQLALTRTLRTGGDKVAFVDRVIRYFRAAGIDPAHPDRHVDPDRLRRIAQTTEAYLAHGLPLPKELTIGG